MNVANAVDTLTGARDLEVAGVGHRRDEAIAGANVTQVAATVGLLKLL